MDQMGVAQIDKCVFGIRECFYKSTCTFIFRSGLLILLNFSSFSELLQIY